MYKINSLLWQRREKGKRRGGFGRRIRRDLWQGGCCRPVAQSCPALCDPRAAACQAPLAGFPSLLSRHQKLGQTHVRWVGDAVVTLDSFLLFHCTDPKSLILLYGGSHNHLKRAFWSERVLLALEFSSFMEAVHSRILGKESKCLVWWWWWFSH